MWGVTSVCAGSVGKVAGLLQEDTHTHTQALLHWSITTAASKRENCFSISIQKHFAWEHKLTYKHRFTLKREVESEMQPYLKKSFYTIVHLYFFFKWWWRWQWALHTVLLRLPQHHTFRKMANFYSWCLQDLLITINHYYISMTISELVFKPCVPKPLVWAQCFWSGWQLGEGRCLVQWFKNWAVMFFFLPIFFPSFLFFFCVCSFF